MKSLFSILLSVCAITPVMAQTNLDEDINNPYYSTMNPSKSSDSIMSKGHNKKIPEGIRVWTIDERFGDQRSAEVDTSSYMYMNTVFTTGLRGEYNTTGNLGAPRINRIFIDRPENSQFIFTDPYDYFVKPVGTFHFTNTYSPITNVTLNECGDRTNGEDDFKAIFAVNAGKKLGLGFRFDYKYGRGYYDSQSTSHFGYTFWSSYLGDRYQAHFLVSLNHQKVTENGGITNDAYVTHPESQSTTYTSDEIPTVLSQNWNRNDNQHIFFTHRYNVGFNRKVKMTEDEIKAKKFAIASKKENEGQKAKEEALKKAKKEGKNISREDLEHQKKFTGRPDDAKIMGDEALVNTKESVDSGRISLNSKAAADSLITEQKKVAEDTSWLKNEYVPVTSFIHTVKFDNFKRIYQAYSTPADYYNNTYDYTGALAGDSIEDLTKHYEIKNTFAIAMLEGFNKWVKSGLKLFANYDYRHYELPDSTASGISKYNEGTLNIGGQLSKTQGTLFHYNVTAEIGVAGQDAGQIQIDGHGDLNFKLFGDTVRLAANAFFHRLNPSFYYRNYHSRHFWWNENDNDFKQMIHSRIEGIFSYDKTRTQLRVGFDQLTNYYYFSQSYNITDSYLRTGVTVTPMQTTSTIGLLTLQLNQRLTYGILNWDNVLTFQQSTDQDILPVPSFNIYSNIYLKFKIAKVLKCDFGADVRYFTKYYAPDYSPALGSYAIQGNKDNRVKVGNYPVVNVYFNFFLKHARFFIMMSHVNIGGSKEYFFTPHYPLNEQILRFGVSWNFFN
ncbi:putative porin [Segatella bryantii]|uniref:putative porin n=1 Tax=Segatella bryantii TaxID=77095 RepID=UPI00241FA690|nr:putative porin [Segatella bryantii]